jgi:hypothetical protein
MPGPINLSWLRNILFAFQSRFRLGANRAAAAAEEDGWSCSVGSDESAIAIPDEMSIEISSAGPGPRLIGGTWTGWMRQYLLLECAFLVVVSGAGNIRVAPG